MNEGNQRPLNFDMPLPRYDVEDSDAVELINHSFCISAQERRQIKELITSSRKIVTFIDGSCVVNPGPGGAGVAFFDSSIVAG